MSLETTRELLEQLKMKHTIEINFLEIAIKEELTGLVHGTSISWRSQSCETKEHPQPDCDTHSSPIVQLWRISISTFKVQCQSGKGISRSEMIHPFLKNL